MLSGDERDRTANLLVANQKLYGEINRRNCFAYNSLHYDTSMMGFSGFYQDFAGFFLVYRHFSAVAESYALVTCAPSSGDPPATQMRIPRS